MPEAPQELDPKPDVPPPRRISRRDLLKIGIGAAAGIGALGALARLGDGESIVAPRPISVEKTGKSPMEGIGRAQQTNGRSENTVEKPIPVILDTDIGYDIDDTWALAMLLRSPELDLKLAVSDTQHTGYAASIIAKMLEAAGRTDVPVGVGVQQHTETGGQLAWVADYELGSYPGEVAEDGVGAIIETIMEAAEPVTLICIGPVPNIAAALEREPRIADRARFVGMHGSIRLGYDGSSEISAEYNVRADPKSLQRAFAAAWDVTVTPLDTCGLVKLTGEKYRRVLQCPDPLARAVIENYRAWAGHGGRRETAEERSSVLFDTVAVYLAFASELLKMERLGIRVTDDGFTLIDEGAKTINCAMEWKDLSAFEDLLVRRLTRG